MAYLYKTTVVFVLLLSGAQCNRPLSPAEQERSHQQSEKELVQQNYDGAMGLRNLGNTCFANSLTKLLWAHSHFPAPDSVEVNAKDAQLKKTFFALMHTLDENWKKVSHKVLERPLTPWPKTDYQARELNHFYDELTKDTGGLIVSDNPNSRIRQHQMDANEYANILFDRLDLGNIWEGLYLASQIAYDNSNIPTKRPAIIDKKKFMLELGVKNVNSMRWAIAHFFGREHLTGDNRYVSDEGQLHDAVKRAYLVVPEGKQPPSQVFVLLKRFKFDRNLARLVKVNKKILPSDFSLDFYREDVFERGENAKEPQPFSQVQYTVKAVVIHSGTGGLSGHYYTYISDNGKWFEHNDSHVSPVEYEAIQNDIDTQGYLFLYQAIQK